MQKITDPHSFQELALKHRSQGLCTALVPTMGFFHEGHLSLMRLARRQADKVYVSLFVNPAQFGPDEDLQAYPQDEEADAALAEENGADILFIPASEAIYAPDHSTWVQVAGLDKGLCGAHRPGHFRGVTTVVSVLFHLCCPTMAVFGEKDWQQLAIIRRMVRDLHIPTRIAAHPIVREADGLAMSSRNVYMTSQERKQAPEVYRGLQALSAQVLQGHTDVSFLKDFLLERYARTVPLGRPDYIEFVQPQSLAPVSEITQPTLVALAMHMGKARILDNILIDTMPRQH